MNTIADVNESWSFLVLLHRRFCICKFVVVLSRYLMDHANLKNNFKKHSELLNAVVIESDRSGLELDKK